MSDSRAQSIPRGVFLLAVLAAFAFGALVHVAVAAHYHTAGYCGSPNGMVHGSSTTDNAWHGRVEVGGCPPTQKVCEAGNLYAPGGTLASASSYQGTCNAFYSGSYQERYGWSSNYYEVVFSAHNHFAH